MFNYRGFEYRQTEVGGPCMLYVDSKPVQDFVNYAALQRFVDQVSLALDVALKDFFVHIQGCMRCRRTYAGEKFSPCKTGVPKFVDGKRTTLQVVEAFLRSLREGQNQAVAAAKSEAG